MIQTAKRTTSADLLSTKLKTKKPARSTKKQTKKKQLPLKFSVISKKKLLMEKVFARGLATCNSPHMYDWVLNVQYHASKT